MGPSDFPPFGPLSCLRLATDTEVKESITSLFELIISPEYNAWRYFDLRDDTWRSGAYYMRHVCYVNSYVEVKISLSTSECLSHVLRLCSQHTGWGKITSLTFKANNKKNVWDTKILFLDSETAKCEVLNHIVLKRISLQMVAAIVNTLLQADSGISHYSVKHIMRYAGYFHADCVLLCL